MTATEENWPRELGRELVRWEIKAGEVRRLSPNPTGASSFSVPLPKSPTRIPKMEVGYSDTSAFRKSKMV